MEQVSSDVPFPHGLCVVCETSEGIVGSSLMTGRGDPVSVRIWNRDEQVISAMSRMLKDLIGL